MMYRSKGIQREKRKKEENVKRKVHLYLAEDNIVLYLVKNSILVRYGYGWSDLQVLD